MNCVFLLALSSAAALPKLALCGSGMNDGSDFKDTSNSPACHRVDYLVDFEEIGLDREYSLVPGVFKAVNIGSCEGSCNKPEIFVSNYYRIRHLHRAMLSLPEEPSCCVPVEYEPLRLYAVGPLEEGGEYAPIFTLDDVKIGKCGCL